LAGSFFTIFAGVGLVSLPFDLVNQWRTRPKPIDLDEYNRRKGQIAVQAQELKTEGKELATRELHHLQSKLSRSEQATLRSDMNRFENAVYLLKHELKILNISMKLRGGNPLIPAAKLVAGVIGGVVSLMWILHICIFVLPDPELDPFLNTLFIGLTLPGFSLFGVIAFGIQVFWLFLCVIKGAFSLGLRVPCLFRLYPMELGNTLLNAFLVNTWILLVCSIPTVHFCAISFPIYARETEVDLLFGTQIKYVKFFSHFFKNNVFVIVMLVLSILSFLYISMCGKNQAQEIENQIAELKKKGPGKGSSV